MYVSCLECRGHVVQVPGEVQVGGKDEGLIADALAHSPPESGLIVGV